MSWFNRSKDNAIQKGLIPDDKGGLWATRQLPNGGKMLHQVQASNPDSGQGQVVSDPPYVYLNGQWFEANSVVMNSQGDVTSGILKYY